MTTKQSKLYKRKILRFFGATQVFFPLPLSLFSHICLLYVYLYIRIARTDGNLPTRLQSYMWGPTRPNTKRSTYIIYIYVCTWYSRNVSLGLGRRMQLLLAIVTSSAYRYKSRRRLSPLRLLIKRATGEISFHTSFLTL